MSDLQDAGLNLKFEIWGFFEILSRKLKFPKRLTTGTVT